MSEISKSTAADGQWMGDELPDCPHAGECVNGCRYGKGCYEDDEQSAMGGKPWSNCLCGIGDGGKPKPAATLPAAPAPTACPICPDGKLIAQQTHWCDKCGTTVATAADCRANVQHMKAGAAPAELADELPQPMRVEFERPHGLVQLEYFTADQMRQQRQEGWRDMHETNITLVGDICKLSEEVERLRAALAARQAPAGVAKPTPTCWIDPIELRELENGTVAMVAPIEGDAQRIPLFRLAPDAGMDARDGAMKFADHIINGMFEGGDWDGGDVQELAVAYGLLVPEEMAGPCREEGCQCAKNGAEFPEICYRKTYLAAITKEPAQ